MLGINVAMDSWDSGSSYLRNKMKLNRLSNENELDSISTTSSSYSKNDGLLLEKDSYVLRKSSINAFFDRAKTENRVILTSSKSLRERSSCPYSYYIDPSQMKLSLVSIFQEFGLHLSREQLLTVCGKCGDDVELLVGGESDNTYTTTTTNINNNTHADNATTSHATSNNNATTNNNTTTNVGSNISSSRDIRLQGRWIPTDREVFVCVNCAQPYWWNEKEDSLPVQAMKRAEELYHTLAIALSTTSNISTSSNIDIMPTIVNDKDIAFITTTNTQLHSRSSSSNNNNITSSTSNHLSLNSIDIIHNNNNKQNNNNSLCIDNVLIDDRSELEKLKESFELRNKAIINQKSILNKNNYNNNVIIIKESIDDTNIDKAINNNAINNGNNSNIYSSTNSSIDIPTIVIDIHITTSTTNIHNSSSCSSNKDAEVLLNSVFTKQGKGGNEPVLTNWNGEFKGTLDYIFVSNQWKVIEASVYPRIEENTNTIKYDDNSITTTISNSNNDIGNSINNIDNPLLSNINTSQPSVLWPSDHFIVQTTLLLS